MHGQPGVPSAHAQPLLPFDADADSPVPVLPPVAVSELDPVRPVTALTPVKLVTGPVLLDSPVIDVSVTPVPSVDMNENE